MQISKLKTIILEHAELVYKTKGEHGIIEFRKHLLAYLKGFANAKLLRTKAVKVENIDEIVQILEELEP
jgi:tRNA-dihydrouridine synthase